MSRSYAHRNRSGFTLIELMMVVAILGVLASILVPKMTMLILRAKESAILAKRTALGSAIHIFYADNDGVYPTDLNQLVGSYINAIPLLEIPAYADNPGHSAIAGVDYQADPLVEDWNDDNAWAYVSSGPSTGSLYINCCHKRLDGARWSADAAIAAWADCP